MLVQDLTRVSWRCVHFLTPRETVTRSAELTEAGVRLVELDGSRVRDQATLFRELQRTLEFPSYFGHNWDAVDECLRDLSWLPAKGYALRVRQARALWATAPESAGVLIESWLCAAEHWADHDTPFHLIFDF